MTCLSWSLAWWMLWQTRRRGLCSGVSNTFRRMLSSLFLLASWSTIWSLALNETFLLCEMEVIIFLILALMFGLLKPSIRPKANLFMNCLRKFLSWRRLSFEVICPHIGILLILFASSIINEDSLKKSEFLMTNFLAAVNGKVDGAVQSYTQMRNRHENVHFLSPKLFSWHYLT